MDFTGTLRKSRLFQRERMQPMHRGDWIKVAAIAGIVAVPILFGLLI